MRANNIPIDHHPAEKLLPTPTARGAGRCRRKFLHFFPEGFRDETYQAWERNYKAEAHREWGRVLNQSLHKALLRKGEFKEVALRAVRIEARTNLIFSFEEMALRAANLKCRGRESFCYRTL